MQVKTPNDVKKLGTILSIWAHPDDETFCAGGILAAAVKNGQKVICVTATRGESGVQDSGRWPKHKLASIREQELQAALKILGVVEHHYLTYKDGQCSTVSLEDGAAGITELIDAHQPDSILTFGSEGLTGHPDHQAVSRWVTAAVSERTNRPLVFHAVLTVGQYTQYLASADAKLNIFYNIDQPPLAEPKDCDICLCCTDELCDCKYDAFSAMPSQYAHVQAQFSQEYLKEAFRIEAFVRSDNAK